VSSGYDKAVGSANANSGAASNDLGQNFVFAYDPHSSLANSTATPKSISIGLGATDGFEFNFAGASDGTKGDVHPFPDNLPSGNSLFLNLQAALGAAHDGHENAVVELAAHEPWSDVQKVLLHASDFQVV